MARYAFPTIAELGFDLKRDKYNDVSGFRFDDTKAIAFVYELFSVIEQLHQSRIVLGDVNPAISCAIQQLKASNN